MAADTTETRTGPPGGGRAWLIWFLGASCFGYAFFHRVTPSVMVADLMREFAVGAAVLGNLSALYFYTYAGLQIPVGVMIDRWGARAMIAISVTLAAAGGLMFALAPSIYPAYGARLLIGAGSAVAFVGTLTLVSRWFPPHRFAFLSGMTMMVGLAGGIGSQGPLAHVVERIGWRDLQLAGAGFGFALALAVWLVVRNAPGPRTRRIVPPVPGTRPGLAATLASVVVRPRIWNIALVAAALSGPMLAFGGLWGVPYLMLRFQLARPDAAFCTSLLFIGWAVGAPVGGWLSDHLGLRKTPLVIAAGLPLAAMVVLFFAPGVSVTIAAVIIFFIGLSSSMMVLCFALAREISPAATHGSVTGFVNAFTVGSGALLQPIIGLMLDWQWDGTMAEGVRVYTVEAYNLAFLSLIASGVLGLVCAAMVPETRCRPLEVT
jgi:MFS family permease